MARSPPTPPPSPPLSLAHATPSSHAQDGPAAPDAQPGSSALRLRVDQRLQRFLDKSVPYTGPRWALFAVVVVLYSLRVYLLHGFYIVTYGVAIFNLNLVIGFLSPAFDPEQDAPGLPETQGDAEFKPFVRRVPEFKFWCAKLWRRPRGDGTQAGRGWRREGSLGSTARPRAGRRRDGHAARAAAVHDRGRARRLAVAAVGRALCLALALCPPATRFRLRLGRAHSHSLTCCVRVPFPG